MLYNGQIWVNSLLYGWSQTTEAEPILTTEAAPTKLFTYYYYYLLRRRRNVEVDFDDYSEDEPERHPAAGLRTAIHCWFSHFPAVLNMQIYNNNDDDDNRFVQSLK